MRNDMNITLDDPFWLTTPFVGFDEEDDGRDEDDGNDDDEGNDDDDDANDNNSSSGDDVERLKSALRKERKLRRDAQRENKSLKKFKDEKEGEDQSETDRARQEAETNKGKAERLARRLRTTEVDNQLIKHASSMNFVDLDDALRLVDRDEIDVDQDEDDPSVIEVDETSVLDALKALAKKKPHLLKEKDEEEEREEPLPSGSKFSGRRKKTKDELDDEKLMEQYPALRR